MSLAVPGSAKDFSLVDVISSRTSVTRKPLTPHIGLFRPADASARTCILNPLQTDTVSLKHRAQADVQDTNSIVGLWY